MRKTLKKQNLRKNFKYRINPGQSKVRKLNQKLRICRWFYNFLRKSALDIWEQEQRKVNYYELQNRLPKLKEEYPFLNKVHSQSLQDVTDRVIKAFQPFYKNQNKVVKLKEKLTVATDKKAEQLKKILAKMKILDCPRKKKPNRYHSFTYTQSNSFELIGSQIKLEKRKPLLINVIKHRELEGTQKSCSIFTKNEKWYTLSLVK